MNPRISTSSRVSAVSLSLPNAVDSVQSDSQRSTPTLPKSYEGIGQASQTSETSETSQGGGMHVDLITGGFPCQPFSVAGERRGDSDERFLWPEIVRVMREIRPRIALFENVPGLLTIDRGRTFNRICSDLISLGYDCLGNRVPACAVGANHRRDRLWIIAISTNPRIERMCERENSTNEILANSGSFSERRKICGRNEKRSSDKPIGCGQVLADTLRDKNIRNDSGGLLTEPAGSGENVPDSNSTGFKEPKQSISRQEKQSSSQLCSDQTNWWLVEPDVGRVAHGIPKRVDRLKCLGNSIVPKVAEIFLKEMRKMI
jgi:DNA (cytosine-5)-methyltransferase 1